MTDQFTIDHLAEVISDLHANACLLEKRDALVLDIDLDRVINLLADADAEMAAVLDRLAELGEAA